MRKYWIHCLHFVKGGIRFLDQWESTQSFVIKEICENSAMEGERKMMTILGQKQQIDLIEIIVN